MKKHKLIAFLLLIILVIQIPLSTIAENLVAPPSATVDTTETPDPTTMESGSTEAPDPATTENESNEATIEHAEASLPSALMGTPRGPALPCDFLTGITISYLDPKDPPYPTDATVKLVYTYQIPDVGVITTGTPYEFKIPSEFYFEGDLSFNVKDGETNIGTVSISKSTSMATLVFTPGVGEDYVKPGAKGEIWMTVKFDPTKIPNDGAQTITFEKANGNSNVDISVPFRVAQIKGDVPISVEGSADAANKKINWTSTFTPTVSNLSTTHTADPQGKISGLVIKNNIAPGTTFDTSMISNATITKDGTPFTDGVFSYDDATKILIYTFNNPVDTGAKFEIKYFSNFTLASFAGANEKTFTSSASTAFNLPQYTENTSVLSFAAVKPLTALSINTTVKISMIMEEKKGTVTGREIEWTVTFNQSDLPVDTVTLTDTLPNGLSITEAKVTDKNGTVVASLGDGSSKMTVITDTGSTFKKDSPSKIELNLGTITNQHTLTYKTQIHPDFYKQNKINPFVNTAVFKGSVGGENISYSKKYSATVLTTLITKSGTYNTQDHRITWKIELNSNNTTMTDATITDVIPAGLTLDTSTIKIGSNLALPADYTYNPTTKELKITMTNIPGDGSKNISFQTAVDDNAIWANNYVEAQPFENKVTLTATVDGGTETIDSSYKPKVKSEVIRLEGLQNDYNYSKKLAKWKLVINNNQMKLTKGVVEIPIPTGHKFNSIITSGITSSYNETTSVLKITIPDMNKGDAPLEILYDTEVTDLTPFDTNPTLPITNTATLISDETITSGVSATATQTVANSVIKKSGKPKSGVQNVAAWSILINENLISMEKPTIVDKLTDELFLDTSSVKLYKLGLTNSKPDNAKRTPVTYGTDSIVYDLTTNTFSFRFEEDITDAYVLEFDTFVDSVKTGAGNKTIQNSASLKGGSVSQTNPSPPISMLVVDDGGTGQKFKGQIILTKKDNLGNPLEGVKFHMNNITLTTDSNGEVVFDKLMVGKKYTAIELAPPDNCIGAPNYAPPEATDIELKGSTPMPVRVDVTNTLINAKLEITKTDEENNPIKGVTFRVKNADATTATYDKKLTTDNTGKVLFEDILYGNYTYEEISAPAQYKLDTTPVAFQITRNDHNTTLKRTMTNSLKIYGFDITVIDQNTSKPLPGVTISVHQKDGVFVGEKTTDENGNVRFDNLKYGDYYYGQTNDLVGYLPTTAKFPISIKDSFVSQTFEKIPIIAHLKIVKTNENNVPIKDVTFKVKSADATTPAYDKTIVTNDGGIALFENLRFGNYTYEEVSAPDLYKVDTTPVAFRITKDMNGSTTKVFIQNKLKTNGLEVTVIDEKTSAILPGVIVGLYQKDGVFLDEKTSDATGKVRFDDLSYGDYLYTETKNIDGYLPNETKYPISIKNDFVSGTLPKVANAQNPGNIENSDLYDIKEGSILSGRLQLEEGATASISTMPINGSLVLGSFGEWTYTPNAGFYGVDLFSFTIIHKDGTKEILTVNVHIVPENTDGQRVEILTANTVKTGDMNNLFIYLFLIVFSSGFIIASIVGYRKKHYRN